MALSPANLRLAKTAIVLLCLAVTRVAHTAWAAQYFSHETLDMISNAASMLMGSQILKRLGDIPLAEYLAELMQMPNGAQVAAKRISTSTSFEDETTSPY